MTNQIKICDNKDLTSDGKKVNPNIVDRDRQILLVTKIGSDIHNEEEFHRGKWSKKIEFILTCLSFVVGFGNVWRFPYICYKNGGGAFLIPYLCVVTFLGLPLIVLEMSLGQYSGQGAATVFRFLPIFQGIGFAMIIITFLVSIYYNMLIAWTLYYFYASFTLNDLPWSSCGNQWNTNKCKKISRNSSIFNYTGTITPSDEYFHNEVLHMSQDIYDINSLNWKLVICLFIAWFFTFVSLLQGVKSIGKVAYFTAIFPYICLFCLLIRGVTLKGSGDGILFFLTPDWNKLIEAQVWVDASQQIFFSLNIAWGGVITLSSYNKFENKLLKDALIITFGNSFTSIFAGFVIFSFMGSIASERGVEVKDVATKGAGLAFILYPDAVTRFPYGQIWSIMFFLMLSLLGFGSQFACMETVVTAIFDLFPQKRKLKVYILGLLCFVMFSCGLIFCTNAGMYIFQLVDNYCATVSAMIVAFMEIIVISWIYGSDKYLDNIKEMVGKYPTPKLYWKIMWQFVCPSVIAIIIVFTIFTTTNPPYGDYNYPNWTTYIGWLIASTSFITIPIVVIYFLCKYWFSAHYPTFKSVVSPNKSWKSESAKKAEINVKEESDNESNDSSKLELEISKFSQKKTALNL